MFGVECYDALDSECIGPMDSMRPRQDGRLGYFAGKWFRCIM
jgi:hypothetical protein